MQNFSKTKDTITDLHSKNKTLSVFPPIEHWRFLSFCYGRIPFFHMKHETKLKHKWNVALYNPCDLNDAHQLKCDTWTDISNAQTTQYCHSEVGRNTLFSVYITTVEYV